MNNPLDRALNVIPKPFRNRYVLVLAAFFFWMILMDRHDFLTQWQLRSTVEKLQDEKAYYKEKIKEEEQVRLELQRDREKIARERYFMKKPGEDVFIIVEEDEQKNPK